MEKLFIIKPVFYFKFVIKQSTKTKSFNTNNGKCKKKLVQMNKQNTDILDTYDLFLGEVRNGNQTRIN